MLRMPDTSIKIDLLPPPFFNVKWQVNTHIVGLFVQVFGQDTSAGIASTGVTGPTFRRNSGKRAPMRGAKTAWANSGGAGSAGPAAGGVGDAKEHQYE
jgi:hypothetical protein